MYTVTNPKQIRRSNGEQEAILGDQRKTHIFSEPLRCGEVRVKILDDNGLETFKIESPTGAMPVEGNGISRELQILEVSEETQYHDLSREIEWLESEISQLQSLFPRFDANQQAKKTNEKIYTLLPRDILNRQKRIAQLRAKINSIAHVIAKAQVAKNDVGKVIGIRGELMPNTPLAETFEALNAEDFVIGYEGIAAMKKLPGRPITREILGNKGEKLDLKTQNTDALPAKVYLSLQTRQIDGCDMTFLTPHTIGLNNNLKFVFTDLHAEASNTQVVSNPGDNPILPLYSVSEWTRQVERVLKTELPVPHTISTQTEQTISRPLPNQEREKVSEDSTLFTAAQRFIEQTTSGVDISAGYVQQSMHLDREGKAVLSLSLNRGMAQKLFGIGEAGRLISTGFRSMSLDDGQTAIHYDSDNGASFPRVFRNEQRSTGSITIETRRTGKPSYIRRAEFSLTRTRGKHDNYSFTLSGSAQALEDILKFTPF